MRARPAHLEQHLTGPLLQNLLTGHAGHEGQHDLRIVVLDQWRNGKASREKPQCLDLAATPHRSIGSEVALDTLRP